MEEFKMPILHIMLGDKEESQFNIEKDLIEIGRKNDNDLVLDDDEISRRHAQLKKTGDEYQIIDLGSENGVLVNNKRVTRQTIHHNDSITIGRYNVIFKTEEGAAKRQDARTRVRRISTLGATSEQKMESSETSKKSTGREGSRPQATAILKSPMGGRLIIESGTNKGEEFNLSNGATIGRNKTCDFTLDDTHASGSHARFQITDKKTKIIDLGSSNGTIVNGTKIDVHTLSNNDKIQIGKTILRFDDPFAKSEKKPEKISEKEERKSKPVLWYGIAAAAIIIIALTAILWNNVNRSNKISNFLQAGELAFKDGAYDQAISNYEQVLRLDNKNFDARSGLSKAENYLESQRLTKEAENQISSNNIEEAQAFLRRALELHPDNSKALDLRSNLTDINDLLHEANMQYASKDFDRAAHSYFGVLKKEPKNQQAIQGILRISEGFNRNGRWSKAIKLSDQLLAFEPNLYEATSIKNDANRNRNQWIAKKTTKVAVKPKKATVDSLNLLIQDAFIIKEYDRCISLARKIQEIDPGNSRAQKFINQVTTNYQQELENAYRQGNIATVDKYIRKLNAINPSDSKVNQYMSLVALERGASVLYDEGILEKKKGNPETAKGKFLASIAKWQSILSKKPDNARAIEGIEKCTAEMGTSTALISQETSPLSKQPVPTQAKASPENIAQAQALMKEAEIIEAEYLDYGGSIDSATEKWNEIINLLPNSHELYKKAQEKLNTYSK